MSGFNLYTSNSISTLFSSLGNRSNGSTIFSGLDYSTLSSIHNGSYKKLLNAYYNKTGNKDAVSSITAGKTDVKKTDTNAVSTRNNASNVSEDIDTLNKSDLWKQKEIKAEDGSKTKEYDKDAIYKAVSSYVKDYSLLVDSTGNSESSSVLRTASSMVNYTKANKSVLASMGISIGADNKLSIDEKTFKGSSMAAVKSAFTGAGSYGKSVQASASMIYGSAAAQVAKQSGTGLYSSGASYSYVNGSIYNSYF